MRKVIAGLVAGLVLGVTGTAGATLTNYWEGQGNTYTCEGVETGMHCKERSGYGLYNIWITPKYVDISRGKKIVYGCKRGFGSIGSACFPG